MECGLWDSPRPIDLIGRTEANPDRWGQTSTRQTGYPELRVPRPDSIWRTLRTEGRRSWTDAGRVYIVASAAPLLAFTLSDRITTTVVEAPEPTTHVRRQRNA